MKRAVHGIFVVLVRRTWLVALATVIVCSALSARAIAALLEASYLGPNAPPAGVSPPPRTEPPPRARKPADASGLVDRNMFCSTCTRADEPGPTSSFSPDAILIATSIGDGEAAARATVRVPSSEVQGSFGVGDEIPGVGEIETIGWTWIDIASNGRRGRLSLMGAATPTTATAPAAPTSEWADRIKKIDDHTFEVDRSLVRDLVGGVAKAGGGVRVVPMTGEHGELTGLRIYGVRDGSLPAALGLKTGDTLQAVNNTKIESANTLLGLYAQLDTLNNVELDGTRAGKPLALTLRLR